MIRNIPQGELLVFFHYHLLPQLAIVSLSRLIILFFFCHLLPLPLPLTPLFKILLPSFIVFSTVSYFPSYASFLHHCELFGWHPLSTFPLPPSILLPYSFATFFSCPLFFFFHCLLLLPLSVLSSVIFYSTSSTALFFLLFPILPIPPSDMFFCYVIPLCSSSPSHCLLLLPSSFPFFCHFLPL